MAGTARGHVAENTAERERMKALVGRLSDAELGGAMPAGWTVASVLAHVAFWDQRAVVLLDEWQRKGVAAVPRPFEEAGVVDWINDAGKALCLALPPRRAAELAISIADQVDARVAALPDAFVAANQAAGSPINLARWQHRREHLDEIEAALRR